jgi:hypothetical protein
MRFKAKVLQFEFLLRCLATMETVSAREVGIGICALLGIATNTQCGPGGDGAIAEGGSDAASDNAINGSDDTLQGPHDQGNMDTEFDTSPDSSADSDTLTADVLNEAISDSPSSACLIQHTTPGHAGAARSAGYSGTGVAYDALYGAPCQMASDCAPACVAAGGDAASCATGSECLAGSGSDGGLGCLPPTYWRTVAGALSESNTTTNAAELILVANPYDDEILLTNFGVSIPDAATITGIQFRVRRATIAGNAVDGAIQILQNGSPVGDNRALADAWPGILTYASYGGAYDLWGVAWTSADIQSTGFGISIAPKYTGPSAGNERAYIDSVRVTVFYRASCD